MLHGIRALAGSSQGPLTAAEVATAFGIEAQMNGGYSIGSSARASQPL